jgi:hypothetical protein
MFHDLLAFLSERVPLSTTSIIASNISFVHMLLLVFEGTQFNSGVDLLLCGSRAKGRFSLLAIGSTTYKPNMLFHFLWWTIKFMIV